MVEDSSDVEKFADFSFEDTQVDATQNEPDKPKQDSGKPQPQASEGIAKSNAELLSATRDLHLTMQNKINLGPS